MAAPQTPQGGPQRGPTGPRRPRAWFARRVAAILSAVAVFGLGGLMYWNDHQTGTAQAATASSTANPSTSSSSSNHQSSGSGDDNSSIVDEITNLIPGLSGNSSASSSSSGTSSSAPSPHSSTRGS